MMVTIVRRYVSLLVISSCCVFIHTNLTDIKMALHTTHDDTNVSLSYVKDRSRDASYVTLVHGNTRRKTKYNKTPYPPYLDPALTVFTVDKMPDANDMPPISNGHVGTVVHSDTMYMNGFYNGYNTTSHRARMQSTSSIKITGLSCDVLQQNFSLDVGRGMYIEHYTCGNVTVEVKMYAHQLISSVFVTAISVINGGVDYVHLNLSQNLGPPSPDVDLINVTHSGDVRIVTMATKEPEYDAGKLTAVAISTVVPSTITIDAGELATHLFLTSVDKNQKIAMMYFQLGLTYFMYGTLESTHLEIWSLNWRQGRIDFGGNAELSRISYAAMYYLYSEIPEFVRYDPFFGISPGGLAYGALNRDYAGHVFWDQETWMFPPVLLLHGEKGKTILTSRIFHHEAAKQYATMRGYQGAMYPWESAYSGLNVCPSTACSKYEQHITGDIALAFRQYIMMSRDTDFLKNKGAADVINDIAAFWMSRVTYNQTAKRYEILEVMPPDEYHYPVNNSAYTNAVARISLLLPKYVGSLINEPPNPKFEEIANKTYIPFNTTGQWHPEFDGYNPDVEVKQADVVLLGFPLMVNFTEEVRKNDLKIYEKVTPGGPAMTWGAFAIGWLELHDISKAATMFQKQFKNVVPPFYIWSEEPNGQGARNFLTGMGGYLQSLIFGYGGFRIFEDRLQFNPILPPNTTQFNLTGIDYQGGSFDFMFAKKYMLVNQTTRASDEMKIVVAATGQAQTLDIGVVVEYSRCKASILLV